jgi:uncharacterized damage-inducible protein DinB
MKETERLADELENSLEGNAWHGPALLEVLGDVSWTIAVARPIAGWKSIWELVLHVIVWEGVALRRLGGDPAQFEIGGPEDWPAPSAAGDEAWRATLDRLRSTTAALAAAVRALPEERLDQPILPAYSTCYHHLHGVVNHNLYHAGQIVVLKRALGLPAIAPKQG